VGLVAWLLLAGAIVPEGVATVSLRFANGFARPVPSAVVVVGHGLSFYLLSLTLRHISLSTTYAVWSAVGTALVARVGVGWPGESLTAVTPGSCWSSAARCCST
jgi:small multidrug resistance pump